MRHLTRSGSEWMTRSSQARQCRSSDLPKAAGLSWGVLAMSRRRPVEALEQLVAFGVLPPAHVLQASDDDAGGYAN